MFDEQIEEILGYLDLGLWEEAHDLVEDLSPEAKTNPHVLAVRVRIYQAAEAWELMVEVARHLVTIEPVKVEHWLHYAAATRYSQGIPPAREILEQALEKFPQNGDIRYTLACHQSEMGDLDQAKENLGLAIKLDPGLKTGSPKRPGNGAALGFV